MKTAEQILRELLEDLEFAQTRPITQVPNQLGGHVEMQLKLDWSHQIQQIHRFLNQ